MKTLFALALVCLMLGASSQNVAAQVLSSPSSNAGVAVHGGSLGLGFGLAVPVSERLNVRGEFNALSVNHDFDKDGITLAAQLKLRSVNAILDWFPFGGGFHLSPGVMLYNGNEVNANALVPGGRKFSLGDEDLTSNPANPVTGAANVSFKRVAPMLVLGWGNIVPRGERRWSIPFELGAVLSKAPTALLSLGGSACDTNGNNCRNIATEPRLQADLAKEQATMNSDLEVLKFIPVLSLGFSYKF